MVMVFRRFQCFSKLLQTCLACIREAVGAADNPQLIPKTHFYQPTNMLTGFVLLFAIGFAIGFGSAAMRSIAGLVLQEYRRILECRFVL